MWHGILTERNGAPLPPRRAASRLSAYVYGNILILGAVAVVDGHQIDHGYAVWLVLGTGLTTYVAHVLADLIAKSSIPEAHGDGASGDQKHGEQKHGEQKHSGQAHEYTGVDGMFDDSQRRVLLDELRDALPIISSATAPAIALAFGWWGVVSWQVAQLIAGGIVVFRIATVQIVAERVRGHPTSARLVLAGLVTAALAAVIVALKVFIGH